MLHQAEYSKEVAKRSMNMAHELAKLTAFEAQWLSEATQDGTLVQQILRQKAPPRVTSILFKECQTSDLTSGLSQSAMLGYLEASCRLWQPS